MSVQDALHQLKLEISENENRKDFSFNEKMVWAKLLEIEYKKIAKENQGTRIDLTSDKLLSNVDSNKKVAEDVGFGNKETYRQAKFVSENADEELIKALDEGQLSVNAAYKQLKEKVKELQDVNNANKIKLEKIKTLEDEISRLQDEIDNRPQSIVEKEVEPKDYDETKTALIDSRQDYLFLKKEYDKKVNELTELKNQIKATESVSAEEEYSKKLKDSTIFFCARVNDFIEKTGGFCWLADHINELPDYEKKSYIKAIDTLNDWVQAIKQNLINN
jgi:ParB family chromosome partitioning protein